MAKFLMKSEYQTPPPHPDPPLWVKYLDHVIKLFHKHAYNIHYFSYFSAVCIRSCGIGGMCMRPGLCLCATGQISPSCGGGGAIGGGQGGTGMFP